MAFIWTDNKLDNSLFAAFSKRKPDELKIRNLIIKGANVNAVDCKGDSVLMDAILNVVDGLDLKFIKLLIDLGADLNYSEEGFNCLFDASLSWSVELVEMLLKAGANPNCLSVDSAESLLDWAEFDQWYNETEENEGAEPMAKIVQLLKDYGAKSVSEIFADKAEQFLNVFASYETGLYTLKGFLKIENIPNADKKLIDTFTKWIVSNPDKCNDYAYHGYNIINPPDLTLLKENNKQGLSLAKKIKKLVGQEVKVEYYYVNPEDFEKIKVRNVEHKIIE